MESQIDTVRLDAETKTRLSTLKRRTGIENWNILCRWAFCISVADASPIRGLRERGVGAVEMTWKTFAGDEEEVYRALIVQRAMSDHGDVDRELLGRTVRQHIARGAARLVGNRGLKSAKDLVDVALKAAGIKPSKE
jgi:DNA sulfur modification protein DndE